MPSGKLMAQGEAVRCYLSCQTPVSVVFPPLFRSGAAGLSCPEILVGIFVSYTRSILKDSAFCEQLLTVLIDLRLSGFTVTDAVSSVCIVICKGLADAFRETLLCDSAFRVIFIFQVAAAVLVGNCCDVAVFTLLKKRMYQIICESLHSLFYTPAQTHSLYSCTVIQKSETDFQYLLFTKFNIFVFLLFFLTIC